MPTPSRYDKIALKVSPHKRRILGFAGVAFLCILISGFAGAYLNGILFSLSGVGLITLIWSWGLFLVLKWFGSDPKASKLPHIIRSGFRWYAAIFLDIWFILGSVASLQVVWKSVLKY
jgi:hypothetical protein